MITYSKEELRRIFQSPFNQDAWKAILQNLFRVDKLRTKPEPFSAPTDNEEGYFMGVTETSDAYRIGLFYYKIKNGSVAHKKVGLRNLVKKFINQNWGEFDAAIVVFDSKPEWRLSFVCDIKEQATAPKRFTFVFGEPDNRYRTPIERFEKLQNQEATFENIRKAFSVDALSNDFFNAYRNLYADFVQFITGKRYVKEGSKWIERVLGRPDSQYETTFNKDDKLVRDYIKKMFGRIVFLYFLQRKGWLNGNRNYMHDLFAVSDKKDNFLDGVLEPLFFEVLNTDKAHRTDTARTLPGIDNIPYLNGGLFARDEIDERTCVFPESYFASLFDFLDSYNFTIDENDLEDAEIGIDPEMLGRIFENLLEDNKDKGTFYTPKEIVSYMCRESIIAYLQNDALTSEDKDRIRHFVETYNGEGLSVDQRVSIKEKLKAVKICDPAIGSGAFPMGLVNLLAKLYSALRITTEAAVIKRHIMEQSIYGVDIEKGAVDIARLRFWLAMIVEEKEPMPLPNLHFKIMQGNSLLESFQGYDLSKLTKIEARINLFESDDYEREDLAELLRKYYKTTDHTKRDRIFNEIIKNVRRQLIAKEVNLPSGVDPSANTDFFLWHTWFSDVFEKGGFDIVIGNPPYGANIDALVTVYEKLFPKTSHGYKDIYKYFFDKGLSLLKTGGILCYITPDTYLRQPRYGDVRRFLLNYQIVQILDLGEGIFNEAVVPVAISLTENSASQNIVKFVDLRDSITVKNAAEILSKIHFDEIPQIEWNNTPNNSFIELKPNFGPNTATLDEILRFKDAGINYQRVKVGLAQKGKSDLSKRLMYEGKKERECDIMFWKGTDIDSFYIQSTTSRFVRPDISLADNERVILNSEYFSICPKLIWRQTAQYPIVTIDSKGVWFGRSIQAGIIKEQYKDKISYEYLCGLLNSSMLRYLYDCAVKEGGRVFPQVKLEKLKPLPIVIAEKDRMTMVEDLVKEIIELKRRGLDSTQKEMELNNIVNKIYSCLD